MKINKHLFICFLLLIILNILYGQNTVSRASHILNLNDGLFHSTVTAIEQDSLGFIWLGSYSGLQRYDGTRLKGYYQSNSKSIYYNRITKLQEQGRYLWVGTEYGIQCVDIVKDKYVELPDKLPDSDVIDILKLNSNNLLYCCEEGIFHIKIDSGDFKFSTFSSEFIPVDLSTQEDNVVGMALYKEKIYAVTPYSLLEFKISDTFTPISQKSIPLNDVFFYERDLLLVKNQLLVSSHNSIFYFTLHKNNTDTLINHGRVLLTKGEVGLPNRILPNNPFFKANADKVFLVSDIGMFSIQFNYQRNVQIQHLKNFSNLSSQSLSSVFIDKSNCLWLASQGSGIEFFPLKTKAFRNIKIENLENELIQPNFVVSITRDNNDFLWLATYSDGLLKLNNNNEIVQVIKHGPGSKNISGSHIRKLKYDAPNNRLIVVNDLHANIINLITGEVLNLNETLNIDGVISTAEAGPGNIIWLGTFSNGLFQANLTTNSITPWQLSDTINKTVVTTSLKYNHNENCLLLGSGDGFFKLQLDSLYNLQQKTHCVPIPGYSYSLKSPLINGMAVENDSVIWVSTIGGGMSRVTLLTNGQYPYKAQNITMENGLKTNDIESFLLDNEKNVWIASNGLTRYKPTDKSLWHFDEYDGIQGTRFNQFAALKDKYGMLYFGGINGVTYFDPLAIEKNHEIVKPAIINILVNNQPVDSIRYFKRKPGLIRNITLLNNLNLHYAESNLNIQFAALHYNNPQKVQYKYFLDGVDKQWHTTNNTIASCSYNNLDPGDYRFYLKSTNNDGVWSPGHLVQQIHINPPWWKTLLAKVLYLVFTIIILYFIFNYQRQYYQVKNRLQIIQLQEHQKEELYQDKMRFFTNITHELRTPLSLILTPLEELYLHENVYEKRKNLKLILKSAQRLRFLVEELIRFRKTELGIEKVQLAKTDVNLFVKDIYQSFENLAGKNAQEIVFEPSENPVNVLIDRDKLATVIFNLISNALKYTPPFGYIKIKVIGENKIKPEMQQGKHVIVDSQVMAKTYIGISISDTGKGIKESEMEQIFNRYFQIAKNNKKGFGIGLALVRNYVVLMQGKISIESTIDKGTDFTILLPVDKHIWKSDEIIDTTSLDITDIPAADDFIESNINLQTSLSTDINFRKILIVEDNPELRGYLASKLSADFKVYEAENGQKGLEIAQKESPAIIISDVIMPVMDGLQLTKQIKANKETCHIPIILLSAKGDIDDQVAGASIGADEYLAKPFSLKLLLAKIYALVENRQRIAQKFNASFHVPVKEITTNKQDSDLINKLIKHIEENIGQSKHNIDELSRIFGINRTSFYNKIRSITEQTPNDFIKSIRLKYALKLMLNENKTIAEAAYAIGMSPSYFSIVFKENFGKTPSEFISAS